MSGMALVVCEKSAHFKCTHKSALSIPGIPTVFTSYSRDSHRIYIAFVGFPPYLHRIRGIPTVFTSHSWDSHRVYIAFVGFPPYLHRIPGVPIVFPGIRNPGNPPFPPCKYCSRNLFK
jgi:hypothetical protein